MDPLPAFRRLIQATTPIPGLGGQVALTLFRLPPPRTVALSEPHEQVWGRRATEQLALGRREIALHRWVTPMARKRVLLAHGWAMNARLWMAWIEPLQRAGFEPFALDFPAHGASSGKRADPERFCRALFAVLDRTGPFEAAIGHSAGGATVATAHARWGGPAPERMVFLGMPASIDALFDYFQSKLELPTASRRVAERAFLHRFGPDLRGREAGVDLARCASEVLLVHDDEDASVPVANLERILRAGGSASAAWAVHRTSGLGHQGVVQDPGVIERAVAHLLASSD